MQNATNTHILGAKASLFTQFLAELRDTQAQADRHRFRLNVARASELLAYEISKEMAYAEVEIVTPLGLAPTPILAGQPVLAAILRAGVPMLEGFLRYYDQADGAFVSAYRQYTNDDSFDIHIEYTNCPPLEGRPLVILDPMVATGRSIVKSWEALRIFGEPSHLFIASLIASEEGLDYVRRHIPRAQIYVGAVDAELTARAYIVPGLGDAGDLAYGAKEPHIVNPDDEE